jgi:hypothetical protein
MERDVISLIRTSIIRGGFNDYIGLEESAEIVTKEQDPIGSQTKVLAVTRKRITFV